MPVFDASKFTTNERWWDSALNSQIDPSKYPLPIPIIRLVDKTRSDQLVIGGRPGVKGCFSARLIDDRVDVAIYLDHEPKEITEAVRAGETIDAMYDVIDEYPGWALHVWGRIRADDCTR